jgi:hypothetical protein
LTFSDLDTSSLLGKYAEDALGAHVGDFSRYRRFFWEFPALGTDYIRWNSAPDATKTYTGRSCVIYWPDDGQIHVKNAQARVQGTRVWKKKGVLVRLLGTLSATLYTGDAFDNNSAAVVPFDPSHLPAIWHYLSSPEFQRAVRVIDQKSSVTNATLTKVPFDLDYWQGVADAAGPLPEPHSDDPTQWLFKGHPVGSTAPLQVTMALLLGYRWPEQDDDDLCEFADKDGIVPLPAMSGELAASERLRSLLARAYGAAWSQAMEQELLATVDYGGKSLDTWLRDGFFKQHCRLFHNRPFVWQIWDGRRDGFSALVNYHRLDKRLLEKFTYSYVGDWIARQQESARRGEEGADARLIAVRRLQDKLKLILEGEPPYDIYVRWKKMHEQPIGWEPDLNDGVRLNIRPFMMAGILRSEPHIKWGIDRGKNPDGSVRDNDRHLSVKERQNARKAVGCP